MLGCKSYPAHEGICRDGKDRPRILTPTGEVRSYSRSSGYGKVLDDLNGLMGWKCRMTALGAVERPDLFEEVKQYADDVNHFRFKVLVEALLEAGGASRAANRGSAVHGLTELVDQALPLGHLPAGIAADLLAYRRTLDLYEIEPLMIEAFCVQDHLRVAGTFDRLVKVDGVDYIADLKTSKSINYPHSWAVQMAIYARSQLYDPTTRERSTLAADRTKALLIWLPADQARCELHWIDIAAGWEAATTLVPAMKAWRNRKDLLTAF